MNKIKILLVDDEKIVLRTVEKLLIREGYELTVAENGQKAIEIGSDFYFDLIVTDVRMPLIDGFEVIKKIKESQEKSRGPHSKFMIITGYSDEDLSLKASQLGVYQFLYKPFDIGSFLNAVKDCLGPDKDCLGEQFLDNKALIDNFIKEQGADNEKLLKSKILPIMGWCNTYVPEEIIIAAGFLPYRITGAPVALNLSKTYLSGNLCSGVQSILECALNGDYKFLDGIIIGASSDTTKKLYDAWVRFVNTPFSHLFDMPKFITESAVTHYTQSVELLIEELEKHFKIKMSSASIKDAVLVCNKTRELLGKLNDLRKANNPPVSAQQFLAICKLAVTSNKKDFNSRMEVLLPKIKPEEEKKAGFRILMTGSFQDQEWLLNVIEERGGVVVCEDLCTRLRYFSGQVNISADSDPIKAIAKRYLYEKPASANLVSTDKRAEYILELVKEFNIDGVIYYILKFDDPYLFEYPEIKEVLVARKIPTLCVETEHNTSAMGQVMTRVQAFMETLKTARMRKAAKVLV